MHQQASKRRRPAAFASRAEIYSAPLIAAVLSLLAAAQALQLWEWRPGTPMGLGGDATFVNAQLGQLVGGSSLRDLGRLGAPFSQNPGWFPSDDQIHFLVIKLLGLVFTSPFTVGALYFVLGFPASALTAYWLMRSLAITRLAAVVGAVLFSVVPGHQLKYEHLWLAGYWVVPLGLWLVFRVGLGLPLWRRLVRGPDSQLPWRDLAFNLRTMVIAVCVALGNVYYLAFLVILLATAAALRLARGDRAFLLHLTPLVLLIGAIAGAAISLSAAGRDADLVTGPTPAKRAPGESEMFAGKLMDLVLPWYHHRSDALRFLTRAYNAGTNPSVEHPALGVIALVGVLALLWMAMRQLVEHSPARLSPALSLVAVLTLVSIGLFTVGGLGSFVALFGTSQIRTWSRLYLYIALFGLVVVAVLLSRVQRRRPNLAVAMAGSLLLLGVADQTNPAAAPDYASMSNRVAESAAFTTELEDVLPDRCAVFQLPVVQFPESPAPAGMKDYDHLLPYLTSTSLRWSYGAMRGTASADWQLALPMDDAGALARDVAGAGFCAIEVDRAGFTPTSDPSTALAAMLGPAVAMSPDGRLAAFDLAKLNHRVLKDPSTAPTSGTGWQVLHPVLATVNAHQAEEEEGRLVQWVGPRASVIVGNMTGRPATVTIEIELIATQSPDWFAEVITPGSRVERVTVPGFRSRTVAVSFEAPPGRSELFLRSDVEQARTLLDGRLVSGKIGDVSIRTSDSQIRAAVAPRTPPPS